MARDFFINGETMVYVKGAAGTSIANLQELGLSEGPIRVTPNFRHQDIAVNAWGNGMVPPEVQTFLSEVLISMPLVHFDRAILDVCLQESMGGTSAIGKLVRTGARLGNGASRFAATCHYISLNLSSPVGSKPWRFLTSYLTGPPMEFPLGTERSVVTLNWRCIPYTTDPFGAGAGANNATLWDHTLDT